MTDVDYTNWVEYPYARLRFELDTRHGRPTRFVVQLEYRFDGEWHPVVRFDHDEHGERAHDVTAEGLHMDVYRDGEKHHVERGFPPVALQDAPHYTMAYIEEHAEYFLGRFERWHDLTRR